MSRLFVIFFVSSVALADGFKCAEILVESFCDLQYLPADCVAHSVAGEPIDPPISASGTNPCFAGISMKYDACMRDLDWKHFQEEDVICTSQPSE